MFRTIFLPALAALALLVAPGARAQGTMDLQASANPAFAGVPFTLTAQVFGPATGIGTFRFRVCDSAGGPCGVDQDVTSCTGPATSNPPPTRSCTVTLGVGTYDTYAYYEGEPTAMPPPGARRVDVVAPNVVLFPTTLATLQVGAPVSTGISVDSEDAPGTYAYALTAGALPPGLSYAAATSQLSGAVTTPGPYSFTITATETTYGFTGSRTYSGSVLASPTLAFAPAPGSPAPVQVAASPNAQAFGSSIAVSLTGGEAGSRRDLGCSLSNATDYALRVEVDGNLVPAMPPSPIAFGSSAVVRLACNTTNPVNAQLTCSEGPLASPIQHTWSLDCSNDPVYGSDPRPTSAVAAYGAIGDFFASASVAISNSGVGPLTLSSCNVTPAGFGLALTNNIPAGGSGTMTIDCTVPAPGTTTTASLSCNTNDPNRLIVLYKLFCVAPPVAATGSSASPIGRLGSPAPDLGALLGSAAAAAEDVDGNEIVVVGAPSGGDDDEGRVYVYVRPRPGGAAGATGVKRDDASLGRPTLTLSMPARAKAANGIGDKFGQSVAVSSDGAFIAVGAPSAGAGGGGSVLLFQRPAGTGWSDLATLTPLEIAAPASANVAAAGFGNKVEFAPDNDLVVGAPNSVVDGITNAGAAYHFDAGYVATPTTLVATTPSGQAQFGAALGFGDVLVVGAPGESSDTGAAYAIDPADVSSPPTRHTAPSGSFGDKWGSSVVVSGPTVVVGAPNDDTASGTDSGSATVLLRVAGTALAPTATIVPPPGAASGAGAALATNGDVVVVGAPASTVQGQLRRGRALVYDLDAAAFGTTTQVATYENTIGGEGDEFASALAIGRRRLVIGSPRGDEGAEVDEGRVDPYVLDRIFRGQFER